MWLVRETFTGGRNIGLQDPVRTRSPEPDSAFRSGYSYLGVEDPWLVFAYALFDEEDSPTGKDSLNVPVLVQAETCIITPCERTYQLSMTAGQLETVILDTDYGISAVLGWPDDKYQGKFRQPEACWRTTSYRGSDAPSPLSRNAKTFLTLTWLPAMGVTPPLGTSSVTMEATNTYQTRSGYLVAKGTATPHTRLPTTERMP